MVTQIPISAASPRRARTREALVAAGLRLLAERPPDAIAIDEIVRAAGVAKGSFFNHFDDKAAFAGEIGASLAAELEGAAAALNHGIDDPAERLARTLCLHLRFAADAPRRARVFLRLCAEPLGPPPRNDAIELDLGSGAATGRFRTRGDAVAGALARGSVHAGMARVVAEPAEAPALGFELAAALLRGLGLAEADAERTAGGAADAIMGRAPSTLTASAPIA